jgi:ABC-type transporter Mla subunit MlaD
VSLLSPFTDLLRSALGVAEQEQGDLLAHSPAARAEEKLDRLGHVLQGAAQSAERQVELLDGVARALPALTEEVSALTAQVNAMNEQAVSLTRQLEELIALLAPLADAERDVSRIERLFRRRH